MSTIPLPPASAVTTPAPAASVAPSFPVAGRQTGAWVGYVSLIAALASLGLVLFSDPLWLTAPMALLAVLCGQFVLRRVDVQHAAANIGNSLGQCVLFLWLLIDVALGLLAGIDFNLIELAK